MRKIQVYVGDEVAAELERRASSEGRKLSAFCAWQLTVAAAASTPGSQAAFTALAETVLPEVAQRQTARKKLIQPLTDLGQKSTKTRTTLCEHRVPAGSFCKRCD